MLNLLFWQFASLKVGLVDLYLSLLHMYLHSYTSAPFYLVLFTHTCVYTHIHKMDNTITICD